jgi:hypothetical protein
MELTRMPYCPSETAMEWVRPSTAPLLAEYASVLGSD